MPDVQLGWNVSVLRFARVESPDANADFVWRLPACLWCRALFFELVRRKRALLFGLLTPVFQVGQPV
jgi:hypothetical protein